MVVDYKQLLPQAEDIDNAPTKNSNGKLLLVSVLGASGLLAMACATCFVTTLVMQVDGAIKFDAKADIRSSVESPKYYWPSSKGNVGSYLRSPYPAKFNLHKPSWTWEYQCCFGCTWCTYTIGLVLDDRKQIYLTSADRVRKFSPTGKLLWIGPREDYEEVHYTAALLDGAVHAISMKGRAYALSMDSGKELWSRKIAKDSSYNYGSTAAQHGVVIHAGEVTKGGGNSKLFGLNATDGNTLWEYEPEAVVWIWGAAFPGDGTFVYMTQDGKVYRQYANSGSLVWKAGGIPGTWCDGGVNVGSNGFVYVPAFDYIQGTDMGNLALNGSLTAYTLSDGQVIWTRNFTRPPNSVPAFGMLAGKTKESVVMPVGVQVTEGQKINVLAFDAETGEDQWVFNGPTQLHTLSPSDGNPLAIGQRLYNHLGIMTLPNPWGMPIIDGNGAVFVGGITGHFFRLQDSNQDGIVAGHGEVVKMWTGADVVAGDAPAIAPGLLAFGNSHSLIVWHE